MIKLALHTFIFLAFPFFSAGGFAQNFIADYYPKINEAEMLIVSEQYSEALAVYREGFVKVQVPFANDAYNALLCAVRLDSTSFATKMATILIQKGASKKLLKNELPKQFLRSRGWKTLSQQYFTNGNRFKGNLNSDLIELADSMFVWDQKFRTKKGSYSIYGDTIAQMDEKNVAILIEQLKSIGFPNENNLGLGGTALTSSPLDIVVRHYYQNVSTERTDTQLLELINLAVAKGEINAHKVAENISLISKYRKEIGPEGYWIFSKKKTAKPLVPIYSDEETIEIDQNRISMGLENLNEYHTKLKYMWRRKKRTFLFCGGPGLNIVPVSEEVQRKMLGGGYIYLLSVIEK